MVNVKKKNCLKCNKTASFNYLNEISGLYCSNHKKKDMVNVVNNIAAKRLCRYCDIMEESAYVCNKCKSRNAKKEYAVIREIKKKISIQSIHNSSSMLQGCSKRRPDLYYDLNKHVVIVEIDENQHKSYEEQCECARINEIVNGIGGRPIVFIRFNPDIIKHKKKKVNIELKDRIPLLIQTIKEEIKKDYDNFFVKIIQLYYDDDYEVYQEIKEENITDKVCI